ncbi:hypothetical protein Taro_047891 [Colocasia esculenta]|uniref:GAGA-binding transcriptional activator n=1 Tax=Colocasia esculenta TaxID=4460 RepID=A0A843X4H5_COLES|nr:hypothetical protein [Colocasia esculenta]
MEDRYASTNQRPERGSEVPDWDRNLKLANPASEIFTFGRLLLTSTDPGRRPLPETDFEMALVDFGWVPQRNLLPTTKSDLNCVPTSQVNPEISVVPAVPLAQSDSLVKATKAKKQPSSTKKPNHVASKVLQPKQPKKQKQHSGSTKRKSGLVSTGKREKRNTDIALRGIEFDFSGVPAPLCSCTGVPRQCYRWGAAGWQPSCCTTAISEYPLPMSPSRPGARLPGRKMSIGAYGKLLQLQLKAMTSRFQLT